ncbi:3-oxoacyl-ACP reductase [Sphingopyxis sp. H038]|uniref:SDR family NAD(P)-dependent oxidoreductase n=1 Tax=unclassified Sphingopyxis TaxID=2614943 RepID=UPI0007302689|nr:3-oxoacyl-ACP reductase [Sphingopyxis sp. H012]KTE08708.1 3-oxoacyl-ACP reductase [Sphingopyxis sp. H053]KTE10233.1 3-oxoacyl-ACP reductase [Sphingopyxis sp. H093]KTE28374.1 3-oxoacyl-ACP reductase [Sphingopyxis sp. H080]KTE32309.1 3-oxoacyl-ACP reductase [Sphingopyxis sp. H038]KTE40934.1 3-oxoacyl-ACP reductase [Sphingopyxis sp. H005]KTE41163.1 3-oxoacyl-ACP reductase [Sphingopyxis sp. H077]KTE66708.1 3-oxoacyl-ACP reductase [Sphingopyxis sp. H085]
MLAGKVALVTGAGQGVGRGIARALARRGARIALVGRTPAKLEAVAAEIGSDAAAFATDVKDAESIRAVVDAVAQHFGAIDILVNNAQEVPLGPLLSVEDAAFEAGFTSGPLASFRLMKACHPHLLRRGGGTIINLASSAAVRWDMANYGAYAAVKQATRALTRAAAAEWGPDGIRVLTIAPHANSPGLQGWIENNPDEAEAFFRTIPLRRVGDCEDDIGNAVAALCGPDLSYLTGATIPLDGGQANFG